MGEMGRKRVKNFDLPKRVHKKGDSYYYVTLTLGVREWRPLGKDLAVAIKAADKINYFAALRGRSANGTQIRRKIFHRDGHRCVYCGATERLCLDHVVPTSAGGGATEENLVTACVSCNAKKHDWPVERFRAKLEA